MKNDQGHGDHIGAIIDTKEFIQHHLRDIIQEGKVLHKVRTNVVSDSVNNEETQVFAITYGDGDIQWISLLAEGKSKKVNEFVTCYPVLKSTKSYEVIILRVEEWSNHIEATITCEIDQDIEISFFATDYLWNKQRYVAGNKLFIDLAALAYSAREAQRGFKFEGQKAVDFLLKMGQKPTYDAQGNVEPVNISTEKMVAFIQSNDDYPDDREYQSPISNIEHHEIRGAKMTSCTMMFKHNPDREMPLYFNSESLPDAEEGMPVHGVLWLQGKISDNQAVENKAPEELGRKGAELVSAFERFVKDGRFDKRNNLNWVFKILDELSIDDGYVLDAYEMGDDMGSRCELYVHKGDAAIEYKPDLNKRKERMRRIFMSKKDKEAAGPFEDYIAPYSDEMYIAHMIDYKEAEQIPPIWGYLTVPFTPMSIWQAFLLTKAYSYLPKKWHGNYNKIDFIFGREDIEQLFLSKGDALGKEDRAFLARCLESGELLPRVEIDGESAIVIFTSWSPWGGLFKRKVPVKKVWSTVLFEEEKQENLIKYDSGLRF